jgi:hypothetical protein
MRLCAILALTVSGSCGGGGGGSSSGGGNSPPINCQNPLPVALAAPRFSTDLLPMFQVTCGGGRDTSSCHGTLSIPAGKFSFYTEAGLRSASQVHSDLVNAPPNNAPTGQGWMRIKPNDVSRSWLIEKVSSDQPGGLGYGARMPAGGQNLCTSTIDNLKTWIQQGATF